MNRAIACLVVGSFLIAGCLGPTDVAGPPQGTLLPLPELREGTAERLENGDVRLFFEGIMDGGPSSLSFPVPTGTTFVKATARVAPQNTVRLSLTDPTNGLGGTWPLCSPSPVTSFTDQFSSVAHCDALAVLSSDASEWSAFVYVPANPYNTALLGHMYTEPVPYTLEVVLSTAALDGSAGKIDLSRLSRPMYNATSPVQTHVVASSDGARLAMEYTLPDGKGPWPTILVSTPYNDLMYRSAGRQPWPEVIADMVPRGYAFATVDVRGYGNSEGCNELLGPKEAQDQYDVVEWIAAQPWSNGRVGMFGISYYGATGVEALVSAPPHLTTVVAAAPAISIWHDFHFGGVSTARSSYEVALFLALVGMPSSPPEDEGSTRRIVYAADAVCDPTILPGYYDHRGLYTPFYDERNFTKRASDARASVFFMQGFFDDDVYGTTVPHFFNDLSVPKKALLGPWGHSYAPRPDTALLVHAWFDYWLQGRDTGIMETPPVEVTTANSLGLRVDDDWPSAELHWDVIGMSPGTLHLDGSRGSGTGTYAAPPTQADGRLQPIEGLPLVLAHSTGPLDAPMYMTGVPSLRIAASLTGAHNTYFHAAIYDKAPDGSRRLVTMGMFNAAHHTGHQRYEAVPPDEVVTYSLEFLPTDAILDVGHSIELEVKAAGVDDWTRPLVGGVTEPGVVTIDYAQTSLRLPTLPADTVAPSPAAATVRVDL